MSYYPAFICTNGHERSTMSYSCSDKYCTECGSPVISRCAECGAAIRGKYESDFAFASSYKIPSYCHRCGKPYPWTVAAIEATVAILRESELTFEEQEKIKSILPDVITETPKTQLAALRLKKAMSTAGSFVADGLKEFVISFGCEMLKKQLGLP